MGPIKSGHGRLGEPGISVNPGMAQEKGDQHLSVSQYQTKSNHLEDQWDSKPNFEEEH